VADRHRERPSRRDPHQLLVGHQPYGEQHRRGSVRSIIVSSCAQVAARAMKACDPRSIWTSARAALTVWGGDTRGPRQFARDHLGTASCGDAWPDRLLIRDRSADLRSEPRRRRPQRASADRAEPHPSGAANPTSQR
jgi:hypothetical protein